MKIRRKCILYLFLQPHISSASVMAFSKNGRFIQLYAFCQKNSLLRIGKHKRCSLSIYHTSFDPHQLHYSIATHTLVKRKKEILFDLKTSVCYLSLVFSRSSFYSAQICKNASAILNGVSFEIKIRFKRYSNDFKGNCMNSFYPIYIL